MSQVQTSQDVLKRLKSVQLLALNLGVPKRTIDPWKEEIESHLVRLSMSSPDQSSQGWEKVEESLKEMQTLLIGDRTVSFFRADVISLGANERRGRGSSVELG